MGENTSMADLLNLAKDNNGGGFGGNNGMFMILILFLLFAGGGLGGGFGGANSAVVNQVNNDFLYTQTKIDNLASGLISQTTALNATMNAGFSGVNMGLCQLGHQIDSGFCATNRNVDSVKFQMAQDTCTITNAIGQSTQSILGYLTGQEIAGLREQLTIARGELSNAAQTAQITERLCPPSRPAYLTSPPGMPVVPFAGAPFGGGCHSNCNPSPWC